MNTPAVVAVAAASAGVVAFCASGLVARAGPIDPPDTAEGGRTLHLRPTPTSGGVAILLGLGVGAAILAALTPAAPDGRLAAALALAGGLGLIGAVDDLFDLGARTKLLAQAAVALVFSALVARIDALPLAPGVELPLGPVAGALGSALWILVATNAVNFMDGANGVSPGAMVVALAALAVAAFQSGEAALGGLAAAAAAAGAGFLPWNLRGRLFQGDAGALLSGFVFAALCLVAARGEGRAVVGVYVGPMALLPFLTDVLLTLLLRARRREPLLEAHRDHLYQLWLQRTGRPHGALAWRIGVIMGLYGIAALLLQQAPRGWRPVLFAAAVVASTAAWVALRRRLERLDTAQAAVK